MDTDLGPGRRGDAAGQVTRRGELLAVVCKNRLRASPQGWVTLTPLSLLL